MRIRNRDRAVRNVTTGEEYKDFQELHDKEGYNINYLTRVASGHNNHIAFGYKWEYITPKPKPKQEPIQPYVRPYENRKVMIVDTGEVFESLEDVYDLRGWSIAEVMKSVSAHKWGDSYKALGYQWAFIN